MPTDEKLSQSHAWQPVKVVEDLAPYLDLDWDRFRRLKFLLGKYPVGGPAQGNNRAELAAIYICLLRAPRSATLTVLSDSAYALRRLQASVREGGLPAGWRSGPSGVLLAGTAALLFLRRAPTRLRKVQGHGRSSANAAADGLAALGRARAARGNPPGAVPGLTASPFSAAVRAQWARFLPS